MAAVPADERPIDRDRLHLLMERERARYVTDNPRSRDLAGPASATLLAGVPMSFMGMLPGAFPLCFETARGNRITDVDGHTYIDFCLGDTGAMAGHSPEAVVEAVRDRLETKGGITTMLPTEDAARVGAELQRRFGLPYWQFALTATDANRWMLRMCRMAQKRPWVLVFSECYHGTVDETIVVVGPDGRPMAKPGNVGPQVDPVQTTKVVEFNDVDALAAALRRATSRRAHGAVDDQHRHRAAAARLSRDGARALRRDRHPADQRRDAHLERRLRRLHRAWGLHPDIVTIGKALAGASRSAPTA